MPNSSNSNAAVTTRNVSDGGAVGYVSGGGAVTQLTSRATGVTLNKNCGTITMNGASLAAGAEATFTVTNSKIQAVTDVVNVCLQSTGTGTPFVFVSAVAVGSFNITITNLHASTADTTADPINFVIVPSVAA